MEPSDFESRIMNQYIAKEGAQYALRLNALHTGFNFREKIKQSKSFIIGLFWFWKLVLIVLGCQTQAQLIKGVLGFPHCFGFVSYLFQFSIKKYPQLLTFLCNERIRSLCIKFVLFGLRWKYSANTRSNFVQVRKYVQQFNTFCIYIFCSPQFYDTFIFTNKDKPYISYCGAIQSTGR